MVSALALWLTLWPGNGPVYPSGTQVAVQPGCSPLLSFLFLDPLPLSREDRGVFQADALALLLGYQGFITRLEASKTGEIFFIMKSGARILYDDGRPKIFEDKLNEPDLQDMLDQVYAPGAIKKHVPKDHDPGRFRMERFLGSVYGATERSVRAHLVRVDFCGTRVLFNNQNGAADALKRVSADLTALLRAKPQMKTFVSPLGGTYNRRAIEGTNRPSPHSFGIAIDLNPKQGAYWRWTSKKLDVFPLRQRYPKEIPAVFERHGFIWGGRWSHYDLMHFEYRPELLIKWNLLKKHNDKSACECTAIRG